jgi:biotin transport system substrate-specific component
MKIVLKDYIIIVMMSVLIGIGGIFLSFPLTPNIPFTMQIFFVFLICFILKPFSALLSVLFYFLIGILGFPVFSNGLSGLAPFISPTSGFLCGFLLFPLSLYIPLKSVLLRLILIFPFFYLAGIFVLSFVTNMSFIKSSAVVGIFIPIDILKLYSAYMISLRLNKIIKKEV